MRVMNSSSFSIIRSEFEKWLTQYTWHRFVTLASNDPFMSADKAVDRLKAWEARVNRKIAGPDWHTRIEDQMWGFFFLEKAGVNSHWHGLIRFMKWYPGQVEKQMQRFDEHGSAAWEKLVPKGTVDIQSVTDQKGLASYVAKSVPGSVSYAYYVVPDEFG